MEKNEKKIWFVNISEYHHRKMGLVSNQYKCLLGRKLHVNHFSNIGRFLAFLGHFSKIHSCEKSFYFIYRLMTDISNSNKNSSTIIK